MRMGGSLFFAGGVTSTNLADFTCFVGKSLKC